MTNSIKMTLDAFMKDKSLSQKQKIGLLNDYNNHLRGMKGKGKRKRHLTGKPLLDEIKQHGGHFGQGGGSFWSWVKGAASTVGNAVANTAKSAYNYAKDKPLSAISKVAGAASLVPTPFSAPLRGISAAAGLAGQALGKGDSQSGGGHRNMYLPDGRVAMAF